MTTPCNETDQTDLKKGSWSVEEDQKLISYIKRYGIWNWSQMPRFAGLSRSGKSCRLRWMNYLKPNVKRGKFSQEEEEIILESHSLLGNRWSAIAPRLSGRTDNDVKNHWHTHLKKHANEHILECVTTEQNDRNISPTFEANNDDKLHESSNHGDYVFESTVMTFENDGSSSTCTTTSKDHDLEFRHNYCDVGSPGTIDDLQCFWDQLCPVENLENANNHPDVFLDPTFQDSYEDPFSSFNFYDNDNNISIFLDP